MITFHVAERGLETRLAEVATDAEFQARAPENFAPNLNWRQVTVADELAMNAWVEAKDEWLRCAWTPNQDADERERNGERMGTLSREMAALEMRPEQVPAGATW